MGGVTAPERGSSELPAHVSVPDEVLEEKSGCGCGPMPARRCLSTSIRGLFRAVQCLHMICPVDEGEEAGVAWCRAK